MNSPDLAMELGNSLRARFRLTGDQEALTASIASLRRAVALAAPDYPRRHLYLVNLGLSLREAFRATGSLVTLDEAIEAHRAAVAATPAEHPHYPGYLSDLAVALNDRFQQTDDAVTLAEVVEVLRRSVALTPAEDKLEARHLHNLGAALVELEARTGSAGDLEEALGVLRRAVRCTTGTDPEAGLYLSGLAAALMASGERNSDAARLQEAVAVARQAAQASGPGASVGLAGLANLAAALTSLYEMTGDAAALSEAVKVGRQTAIAASAARQPEVMLQSLASLAWALTHQAEAEPDRAPAILDEAIALNRRLLQTLPEGHSDYPRIWANLAYATSRRIAGNRAGAAPADIAETIDAGRRATALLPSGHPQRHRATLALGVALGLLSERTGDPAALAELAELMRELVADVAVTEADRAGCQAFLGSALVRLAGRSGDTAGLAEAITSAQAALAATPSEDPRYAERLWGLGNAYRYSAEAAGDRAALAEAIAAHRRALLHTREDDPERPHRLASLGQALRLEFDFSADRAVLSETVQVRRQVVAQAAADDPERPVWLSDLGDILRIDYLATGDGRTLAEAVGVLRDAVETEDLGNSEFTVLTHLGSALGQQYARTGELPSLSEAVEVSRRAARAAADRDPNNHATCLSNLAALLGDLYERTGDFAALTEALDAARRAVALSAREHSSWPLRLNTLSLRLCQVHRRTGSSVVLEEALAASRQASAEVQPTHRSYAPLLNSHGLTSLEAFGLTGRQEHIDESIKAFRRAADAAYARSDRAGCLGNLSSALIDRADLTNDAEDLEQAATAARLAAAALPAGHPARAVGLLQLSRALCGLHSRTAAPELLSAGRRAAQEAADSDEADPMVRLHAARVLARIEAAAGKADCALAAVERAVALLPRVADFSLHQSDQRLRIARISGLPAEAAAYAVAAKRPERAVELLEQARGIILAREMDIRDDTGELRDRSPDLAERFMNLRQALRAIEAAGTSYDPLGMPLKLTEPASRGDAAITGVLDAIRGLSEQRRVVARERDVLLAEIRALPDFENFLRPPTYASLCAHAAAGPVVYLYCAQARADALVVRADGPVRVVPLPKAGYRTAASQVDRFLRAVRSPAGAAADANAEIRDVLAWVGEAIIEPVMTAIGDSPRVWWCPVGRLAFLPLHAAGDALDHVVSSYTATIRALARARARTLARALAPAEIRARQGGSPAQENALIVESAGADDSRLPGVVREVDELSRVLPSCQALRGPDADVGTVTAALPTADPAHFACHGVSDWSDPARSGLILHGGELLTVAAIARLDLSRAQFAYLSACSTAQTAPELTDEATHLSSAFQLAGYNHVIATLWPINDRFAAQVARTVYQQLLVDAGGRLDTAATAAVLHRTAREARKKFPDLPIRWAAFIHTGP